MGPVATFRQMEQAGTLGAWARNRIAQASDAEWADFVDRLTDDIRKCGRAAEDRSRKAWARPSCCSTPALFLPVFCSWWCPDCHTLT